MTPKTMSFPPQQLEALERLVTQFRKRGDRVDGTWFPTWANLVRAAVDDYLAKHRPKRAPKRAPKRTAKRKAKR